MNRVMLANSTAAKDPQEGAFMRAVVNFWAGNPEFGIPPELKQQASAIDINTVSDPLLLIMIGTCDPNPELRNVAFNKAVSLLPNTTYPKFIWFVVAANAGQAAHQAEADPEHQAARDALSLKYLDEGLRDDSFLPNDMSALRWRFESGSSLDLLSRQRQKMVDIVGGSPKVDSWVKDYIAGVNFVEEAWASRGSGWSNTVSQQGWQGFSQNLALARSRLVKSWNENPHDPAAAAEMITVCMGENEETDTMRSWFDRAVAAEFDYMGAYDKMMTGLRPRWLGSYDDMNAFGRECAATQRYDTLVPYERVVVTLDNAEDQNADDQNDHGAQYQNPDLANEVLTVLDKYFAEPNPPIPVAYAHTIAAIVAHKAGRMDEVKKHLAAIDYKPTVTPFLTKLDDLRQLAAQAQAMGGP
jgi:hypothetical protein